MSARKKVIQGGTSASKTFGILAVLIDHAARHPKSEISVVSESVPHLRRGAIKDFAKKVELSELTIVKISKEISDILGIVPESWL